MSLVDEEEEDGRSYRGLTIKRGKRHCKIVDEQNEVIFRTTNLRDAEHYLELIESNDRLQRLLDARGIAPHRLYLLARDEDRRGRVNQESAPASEVVIVAKADDDSAVVVRHLEDGREEIVDLDEIEPIEGGAYLQGPAVTDETVVVVMRVDREREEVSLTALRSAEQADLCVTQWAADESPGHEYKASLVHAEGDVVIYRLEVSIED